LPAVGCRSQRCRQNPARRLSSLSPTPDPGHFQLRGPRRSKSSAADGRLLARGQRQRGLMIAQVFPLFASRSTQKATITLSDRANLRSAHSGRRLSAASARRIARLVSASKISLVQCRSFGPCELARGPRSAIVFDAHAGVSQRQRPYLANRDNRHIATRPCLSDR
jgi:hypothetical protein